MVRRLQKANGVDMSSIIRTLSYEDDGIEVGNIQYEDSSIQIIKRVKAAQLDSMDETEDGVHQLSAFADIMLLESIERISSSIFLIEDDSLEIQNANN